MKKPKLLAGSTLRRPFIVTVSAVTVVATAACGGMTTEPTPSECPEAQPSNGESCAPTSTTPALCSYGSCYGVPTITATCGDDGTWRVSRMSCNPPPPATCPETRPADGLPCGDASTLTCEYGSCDGVPTITATCGDDGTWRVIEMSCNPPPPMCPDTKPVEGEACSVARGTECGYEDCYGTPAVTALCGLDGKWSVAERSCNPPPPECPAAKPAEGAACNLDPSMECGYEDCNGTPAVTATCGTDGKWSVVETTCNPPKP